MIYTEKTVKAMQLAFKYHNGQYDKSGAPYIFHVFAVANACQTEDTTCVGLLHDLLEDTDCTVDELLKHFQVDVVDAVITLTHKKGTNYFDYVRDIKRNPLALEVKLSDIKNNTQQDRMSMLPLEKRKRLQKKYQKALNILSGKEE